MRKLGDLVIRGAREHNLKDINLTLPRNRLIVITGLSGSGKSSLAFDTIYAEGQRRYVESLSSYARQFLGQMEKPDVDRIEGLSPAISIEQKTSSRNPRSTVGTMTEIYDYIRLLFARVGVPHCYECGRVISQQSTAQIAERLLSLPERSRVEILSPVVRGRKGEHRKLFETVQKEGFVRVRVNGEIFDASNPPKLNKQKKHNIEIVVDRLSVSPKHARRIADSLETASRFSDGLIMVSLSGKEEILFSRKFACPYCDVSFGELSPRMFSFNSPYGACEDCGGLGTRMEFNLELIVPDKTVPLREGGIVPLGKLKGEWGRNQLEALGNLYGFDLDYSFEKLNQRSKEAILHGTDREITVLLDFERVKGEYRTKYEGIIPWLKRRYRQTSSEGVRKWIESFMSVENCASCGGSRLKPESLAVRIGGMNIADLCRMSVQRAMETVSELELDGNEKLVGEPVLKEITQRLKFLVDVGLSYLSLDRSAVTLAGGEAQRLRLATQIGSRLMGVLYILDEPSIGLHHKDNTKLIRTLKELRDIGNTVIVIEHDRETILSADYIVDLGPGAGLEGGDVVAAGTPLEVMSEPRSATGRYLCLEPPEIKPVALKRGGGKWLVVKGASENNLKHIDVAFPLGLFNCVTGVSGSGKSTLINDILYKALHRRFYDSHDFPGAHEAILGAEYIDKVIDIDQSPIGRTPRSNPATYTGLFTPIRNLFSQLPESRMRGYKVGRFSFNVPGGRCEKCSGDGVIKVEMHFLPDVYVKCEACKGKRYNQETLEVTFKGHSIADVLDMSVDEAHELFINVPAVRRKCATLLSVGLGYIKLGQQATTLSGGEAQRVKLAAELSKHGTGKTLYILDEPTTGLHHEDVQLLLDVLNKLVDKGNTVIVIEHNPDVILAAEHIIDLGPEGGEAGGELVATGTPYEIMQCPDSHTGEMFRELAKRRSNSTSTARPGESDVSDPAKRSRAGAK
ncbi:MAG: excinuclease ABC subunit UvrA [Candidatus Latescibacteria bacterium]|nr:excinuclease ABC subunit UvrA [Candidatus Latescibacterota bacterium]NIO27316.1 excinuclease ABC subunit UvrA [Candidatus Latescibacterota bacterium]NIO54840.1 excinuclease ABC subunit UvrA [Candidatus Latescibacterota bacterium]NIT00923.1 excinuclease ABC subunit UvrA [Candidatus Latescibacterota bacterium]NIT37846.1 excinuclease ABC subunit UvrA [Candidatus Latescibacterota bacterium]